MAELAGRSRPEFSVLPFHGAPPSSLDFLLDEIVDRIANRVAERLGERWLGGAVSHGGELLSVGEASELLRCKPQRVYDLRSAGRLPKTNEGGRAVVRRADLERLVEEF